MTNFGHSERSEESHKLSYKCRHSVLDTESQSLPNENLFLTSLGKGKSIDNELAIAEQVRNDVGNDDGKDSSRFTLHTSCKRAAFTLAEVLITLGIIGVVAAMTIPSLVQNYQEKATVTKVKKFYSVFSQAYLMAVEEHGPICDWGLEDSELVEDEDGNKIHSDNSFEQADKFFGIIEQYLPKGKYKKLHNTSVGNENEGYVMLDGTRIIGMWLKPSNCTLNKPTSYCGDFYVVFDNKNYYESRVESNGKYFKPSVFAFYINPARIFPVGADDAVF